MIVPVPEALKIDVKTAISGWEARTRSVFEGAWYSIGYEDPSDGYWTVRWQHRTGRKNWVRHFGNENSPEVSDLLSRVLGLCHQHGYILTELWVSQNHPRLVMRVRTHDGISIHSTIDNLITVSGV